MNDPAQATTLSERADALEEHMMHELEHIVTKSVLFNLADGKVTTDDGGVLMALTDAGNILDAANRQAGQAELDLEHALI